MKNIRIAVIAISAASLVVLGAHDASARGGGHGGGSRGGGGWSGSRGGGGHFDEGREFNRDHDFNRNRDFDRGDHVRPDPDHRVHPRPTPPAPPAPPPPPTYNVNVNAPDGWYGAGDDALAGMMIGTAIGSAAASNRDSEPATVVVEQSPVVVTGYMAVGSQSAMLPAGSQARTVNGAIYYQNGDTWYKPYFAANGVYYEVVPSPNTAGR